VGYGRSQQEGEENKVQEESQESYAEKEVCCPALSIEAQGRSEEQGCPEKEICPQKNRNPAYPEARANGVYTAACSAGACGLARDKQTG
jgi:hypothetical protein